MSVNLPLAGDGFVGFVLQTVGLFAIGGTALSAARSRRAREGERPGARRPYAEYATLAGAAFGVVGFFVLYAVQEVS